MADANSKEGALQGEFVSLISSTMPAVSGTSVFPENLIETLDADEFLDYLIELPMLESATKLPPHEHVQGQEISVLNDHARPNDGSAVLGPRARPTISQDENNAHNVTKTRRTVLLSEILGEDAPRLSSQNTQDSEPIGHVSSLRAPATEEAMNTGKFNQISSTQKIHMAWTEGEVTQSLNFPDFIFNFYSWLFPCMQVKQIAQLIGSFTTDNQCVDWGVVGSFMGRTPQNCKEKWDAVIQHAIPLGPYSAAEDLLIIRRVAEWGDRGNGLWVNLQNEMGKSSASLNGRWRTLRKRQERMDAGK